MTAAIISAAAAVAVSIIEALASRERKRDKVERAAALERQKLQEQLLVKLIESTWAAIALGEATATAVQRIPDARCNGDMTKALEYAAEVKHAQKEFLTRQGVRAILDMEGAA